MTGSSIWRACLCLVAADPEPPQCVTLPNREEAVPRRTYRDVMLTDARGTALLHDGYVSIEV
jgi:hypothetical protein